MRRKIIFIAVLLQCALLGAQEGRGDLRFVWYNVENLYDPFDDSLTLDEEFLPEAERHWTWRRFEEKINRICKVIAGVGGWKPPGIVALGEVENSFVLKRLCRESLLLKYGYRWIHEDSPDPRGIDIGLLYLPAAFLPLNYTYHRVEISSDPDEGTRDILHVTGVVNDTDTLHLVLNHWPSRWRGQLETEPGRRIAACRARSLFDSIMKANPGAKVIVAGDFNDEQEDPSIREVLGVVPCEGITADTGLYSIRTNGTGTVTGTLKYRGRWYAFDRIFASGSLLSGSGLSVRCDGEQVYRPAFLLERDVQWLGSKPLRTWNGYRYRGGFSDHLPVYADLWFGE